MTNHPVTSPLRAERGSPTTDSGITIRRPAGGRAGIPIGERGGVNLYGFGFNNPYGHVDGLGNEPIVTGIGAAVSTGEAVTGRGVAAGTAAGSGAWTNPIGWIAIKLSIISWEVEVGLGQIEEIIEANREEDEVGKAALNAFRCGTQWF